MRIRKFMTLRMVSQAAQAAQVMPAREVLLITVLAMIARAKIDWYVI